MGELFDTIRKVKYKQMWHFVVADVIRVLTDCKKPSQYLSSLKKRDHALNNEWNNLVARVPLETPSGLQYVNVMSSENVFRLIQSIQTKKAELFKRWLARLAFEKVNDHPRHALKRMRSYYHEKGYSDEWIDKRIRGIAIHDELLREWDKRGIKGKEYSVLTSEISKMTFGLTPHEYKELKGLHKEQLRDHMTDLELIFSMLGERATTEIIRMRNSHGLSENLVAAERGGRIAGNARKKLELESGTPVVQAGNFLETAEKVKKLT